MPEFRYTAYLVDGSLEVGNVVAATRVEALRALAKDNKRPLNIDETFSAWALSAFGGGQSRRGKMNLARTFADIAALLDAGFTIDVAMRMIASTETNKYRQHRMVSLVDRLSAGAKPSEAFGALDEMPAYVIALIASGQSSGRMPLVFSRLSEKLQTAADRRSAMLEALSYPAFLVIVMIGAVGFLALVLAPTLEPLFDSPGQAMPTAIFVLSSIGVFLRGYALHPVLGLLVGLGLTAASLRGGIHRIALPSLLSRLPIVTPLVEKAALSRYFDTLGLLLGNGVLMVDALRLAVGTVTINRLKAALEKTPEEVASGKRLSQALASTGVVDDQSVSLVRLGEESNSLPHVLSRLAALGEDQVRRSLDRYTTFLTPALTIMLGLMIGGLIVSVMSALLSINDLAV